MAYKLPKAFKPAVLDSDAVDAASLNSSKTQLWHFTFPLDFNVAGFSELELHLPAEPISSASQVPQMVASFELDGASYRIIEGSVFETADLVNLFPSASAADSASLQPGKPFTRSFRICRDILFPAPPNRPIPVNPLGRAPRQLEAMRKNFLPIGYMHESFGRAALEAGNKQGRVLRSGSARPSSPRLLPKHGFDLAEWKPKRSAAGGSAAAASSASAGSAAEEAARKAAKKEKKEAKRRAEALATAASSSSADAAESSNKKQRTSSSAEGESTKKKKKDKH